MNNEKTTASRCRFEARLTFYRLCEAHRELVRDGKLTEANGLLRLLNHGYITLGLSDESCRCEIALERLGLNPRYSRNYNHATFRINDHR